MLLPDLMVFMLFACRVNLGLAMKTKQKATVGEVKTLWWIGASHTKGNKVIWQLDDRTLSGSRFQPSVIKEYFNGGLWIFTSCLKIDGVRDTDFGKYTAKLVGTDEEFSIDLEKSPSKLSKTDGNLPKRSPRSDTKPSENKPRFINHNNSTLNRVPLKPTERKLPSSGKTSSNQDKENENLIQANHINEKVSSKTRVEQKPSRNSTKRVPLKPTERKLPSSGKTSSNQDKENENPTQANHINEKVSSKTRVEQKPSRNSTTNREGSLESQNSVPKGISPQPVRRTQQTVQSPLKAVNQKPKSNPEGSSAKIQLNSKSSSANPRPTTIIGGHHKEPTSWTLVYTAIVNRHGTRDASRVVSLLSEEERKKWSRGSGGLTKIGIAGMRNLGRKLKERYDVLLRNVKKSDIRAFTTSTDRTRTSARLLLEQIYGPKHEEIKLIDLSDRWNDGDRMRSLDIMNSVDLSEFKEFEKRVFEIIYPKVKRRMPNFTVDKLYDFMDTILCEVGNGVKFPPDIMMEMSLLNEFKYRTFAKQHANVDIMKAIAGPYFSDIFESMNNIIRGKKRTPKLEIFATHDSYIQTIMRGLDPIKPFHDYFKTDFGCGIFFELYKSDKPADSKNSDNYIVKVYYNYDTSLRKVRVVPLGRCQRNTLSPSERSITSEPFCFSHQFVDVIKKFVMNKYEFYEHCTGTECRSEEDYVKLTGTGETDLGSDSE